MQKKFEGKLVYNDLAEFEVHSDEQIHNISKIFNKVYVQARPYINLFVDGIICAIVDEEGILYKAFDGSLFDWHINGVPVAKRLFNHVDEYVEIVIYADMEDTKDESETVTI